MNDLTLKDKQDIVAVCIKQTNAQIYNMTINMRVAKVAEDDKLIEDTKKQLAVLMKKKDEYEKILNEIQKEDKPKQE